MTQAPIALIAAMAKNRVIGLNNGLPWRIPEDMRRFKSLTMGKPIIMGRKTFASIGKVLPGRTNIVVSRQHKLELAGLTLASSLEQALELADQLKPSEIMVIGGAQLYDQALPLASRMYLTFIDAEPPGDTFFPVFDPLDWQEQARESFISEPSRLKADFVTLERLEPELN
jgi:dihydrofolate reductase